MTRRLPSQSLQRLAAFCVGLLLAPLGGIAQTHKVAAPERVTRAIAVYEWTGPIEKPTADRLVPVSIFIGGHMEDADIYLARPVPLALQAGNVYEVDEAGSKKGIFDVDHARNMQSFTKVVSDTSASGWYGFGSFAPPSKTKVATLQPSKQLASINSTGDSTRPHLGTRSSDDTSASTPAKTPDTTKPDSPKADTNDPDRPKLNRPTDTAPTTSTTSKDDDLDRPTLRKRDPAEDAQRRKTASQSGVKGPDVSLNDDPDRPTMRHGKPTTENAQDLIGLPPDMHQAAAVSDAANRPEHIFARDWESPTERTDTLAKLQVLARPQIAKYVATNQLELGTPTLPPTTTVAPPMPTAVATPPSSSDDENAPKLQRGVPKEYQSPSATPKLTPTPKATAKTTTPARRSSAKPSPLKAGTPSGPMMLSDQQITPYTLSYGGLPTFVYTAQASLKTGGPVYVTLVAQRMISGELQVAMTSITDASHLDRTPWMRLVDAVDPDASHRASLLFELRGQTSRQFALYRLVTAQAEQTFITNAL